MHSGSSDQTLAAILEHLEAVDLERQELRKEARWMNIRVVALEQSLKQAVDGNEAIFESLERCFSEVQQFEDRVAPRLTQLETNEIDVNSRLTSLNQEVLSARRDSQVAATEFDGWVAEILGLLHEAKLMAVQARSSADVTSDKTDQMVIDLRDVTATIEESVETTEELIEQVKVAADDSTAQRQVLLDRFAGFEADFEDLSAEVASEFELSAERATKAHDRLSAEMADVSSDLAEVTEQFDAVSETAEGAKSKAADISDELAATVQEVQRSQGIVAEMARGLEAAMDRAVLAEERLAESIAAVSDDVAAQGRRSDTADARADDLEGELGAASDLVSEISSAVGATDGRVDELVAELRELVARSESAESEIASVSDGLSVVGAEVADVRGDVALVRGDLGDVVDLVGEAQATADKANDRGGRIERRLAAEIAGMSSQLAEKADVFEPDGRIDELVVELRELVARAEAADSEIALVRGHIGEIVELVDETETRVTADVEVVSQGVAALSGDLEGLTSDVAGVSASAERTDHKATNTEGRVDELVSELRELVARADAAENQVNNVAGHVDEVEKLVGDSEARLDARISDVGRATGAVSETDRRVDQIAAELRELVARAKATESEVSSVSNDLSAVGAEVKDVRGEVKDVQSNLAELASQVGDVEELATDDNTDRRVDELVGELSALLARTTETENEVSSVSDGLSIVGGQIIDLRGDVGEVAELAGESEMRMHAEVTSVSNDVADLSSANDEVAAEVAELSDELKEAVELTGEAQATADKAHDRAEYAANEGDELRADFDYEVARRIAEGKTVDNEARLHLATALKKLDVEADRIRRGVDLAVAKQTEETEASGPEADHKDRYRRRWEEHLEIQAEQRRKRAERK